MEIRFPQQMTDCHVLVINNLFFVSLLKEYLQYTHQGIIGKLENKK